MRRRLLVVVACAAALPGRGICAGGPPNSYEYVGWPLDDSVTLTLPTADNRVGRLIMAKGHAVADVEYCNDDSRYYCFVSSTYTFGVPKLRQSDETFWDFKGYRFEVLQDRRTVQFFGCRTSDVALIRAVAKTLAEASVSEDAFFYYSKTHGLLGFGLIPSLAVTKLPPAITSAGGWWLQSRLGFGATITEDKAWHSCE